MRGGREEKCGMVVEQKNKTQKHKDQNTKQKKKQNILNP